MTTRHRSSPIILCLLALSACEIGFAPLGGVGDDTGTGVGDEADTTDEGSTGPSDPDTSSEDSTSSSEDSGGSESGGSERGGSEGETDTAAGLGTDTDTGAPEDQPSPEQLAEIDDMLGDLEAIVAGGLAFFDKQQDEEPLHRCPYIDGSLANSEASFTPQNSLHCNEFPEGCVPVADADADADAGEYPMAVWLENPMWERTGWHRPEGVGHFFTYNLIVSNAEQGYGACDLTAIARADLDGDFVFAFYTLSAHVDEEGVTIEPLMIENPYE